MNCYSVSKMQVKGGYLKSMGGIIGCYDITNIGSKIINCPYFLYGCYNNGSESYSIIKEAVNVTSFQGDFIEKESFLNGIPLSCLPVYSKDAYENVSNCCWIYQNGQFSKLYWE